MEHSKTTHKSRIVKNSYNEQRRNSWQSKHLAYAMVYDIMLVLLMCCNKRAKGKKAKSQEGPN